MADERREGGGRDREIFSGKGGRERRGEGKIVRGQREGGVQANCTNKVPEGSLRPMSQ